MTQPFHPRRDLRSDPTFLRIAGRSGGLGVRDLLFRVRAAMEAEGIARQGCNRVETVLAEVLNNIAEHAYRGQADGPIALALGFNGTALSIHVTDRGEGLAGARLPPGDGPHLDVPTEHLPEGGFGWRLIRNMTTGLTYIHKDGRNHLCFQVPDIRSEPSSL